MNTDFSSSSGRANANSSTSRSAPASGFRGHDVVDPNHRLIGTISGVVCDGDGQAQWAVVDLGLLQSSHFLPVKAGYMAASGEFVVPYDKTIVKSAPKADRSHALDSSTKSALERHYELS